MPSVYGGFGNFGNWFFNTLITVFVTMVFMYVIMWVSRKYNIPIAKQVSEGISGEE